MLNEITTNLQALFIDYYSALPKYLQLANCIIKAITEGIIKENDILPSINELSFEFEISRDTAEKGYKHLKKWHFRFSAGQGLLCKKNGPESKTENIFIV